MEAYSLLFLLLAIIAIVAAGSVNNGVTDREGTRAKRAAEIEARRRLAGDTRNIRSVKR